MFVKSKGSTATMSNASSVPFGGNSLVKEITKMTLHRPKESVVKPSVTFLRSKKSLVKKIPNESLFSSKKSVMKKISDESLPTQRRISMKKMLLSLTTVETSVGHQCDSETSSMQPPSCLPDEELPEMEIEESEQFETSEHAERRRVEETLELLGEVNSAKTRVEEISQVRTVKELQGYLESLSVLYEEVKEVPPKAIQRLLGASTDSHQRHYSRGDLHKVPDHIVKQCGDEVKRLLARHQEILYSHLDNHLAQCDQRSLLLSDTFEWLNKHFDIFKSRLLDFEDLDSVMDNAPELLNRLGNILEVFSKEVVKVLNIFKAMAHLKKPPRKIKKKKSPPADSDVSFIVPDVTVLMRSKEKWGWSITKVQEVLELGIKFTDNPPTKKALQFGIQLFKNMVAACQGDFDAYDTVTRQLETLPADIESVNALASENAVQTEEMQNKIADLQTDCIQLKDLLVNADNEKNALLKEIEALRLILEQLSSQPAPEPVVASPMVKRSSIVEHRTSIISMDSSASDESSQSSRKSGGANLISKLQAELQEYEAVVEDVSAKLQMLDNSSKRLEDQDSSDSVSVTSEISKGRRKWQQAGSETISVVRIKGLPLLSRRAVQQDNQGKSVKKKSEPSQKLSHSKQPSAIVKNTFSDGAASQSAEEVDHSLTLTQKSSTYTSLLQKPSKSKPDPQLKNIQENLASILKIYIRLGTHLSTLLDSHGMNLLGKNIIAARNKLAKVTNNPKDIISTMTSSVEAYFLEIKQVLIKAFQAFTIDPRSKKEREMRMLMIHSLEEEHASVINRQQNIKMQYAVMWFMYLRLCQQAVDRSRALEEEKESLKRSYSGLRLSEKLIHLQDSTEKDLLMSRTTILQNFKLLESALKEQKITQDCFDAAMESLTQLEDVFDEQFYCFAKLYQLHRQAVNLEVLLYEERAWPEVNVVIMNRLENYVRAKKMKMELERSAIKKHMLFLQRKKDDVLYETFSVFTKILLKTGMLLIFPKPKELFGKEMKDVKYSPLFKLLDRVLQKTLVPLINVSNFSEVLNSGKLSVSIHDQGVNLYLDSHYNFLEFMKTSPRHYIPRHSLVGPAASPEISPVQSEIHVETLSRNLTRPAQLNVASFYSILRDRILSTHIEVEEAEMNDSFNMDDVLENDDNVLI